MGRGLRDKVSDWIGKRPRAHAPGRNHERSFPMKNRTDMHPLPPHSGPILPQNGCQGNGFVIVSECRQYVVEGGRTHQSIRRRILFREAPGWSRGNLPERRQNATAAHEQGSASPVGQGKLCDPLDPGTGPYRSAVLGRVPEERANRLCSPQGLRGIGGPEDPDDDRPPWDWWRLADEF